MALEFSSCFAWVSFNDFLFPLSWPRYQLPVCCFVGACGRSYSLSQVFTRGYAHVAVAQTHGGESTSPTVTLSVTTRAALTNGVLAEFCKQRFEMS